MRRTSHKLKHSTIMIGLCICSFILICGASCSNSSTIREPLQKEINIISPNDEEIISIANDQVTKFAKSYKKGDGANYADYTDHYYMKGLLLQWESNFDCVEYTITLANNYELTDNIKNITTKETKYLVDDLFVNTKYYYRISGFGINEIIKSNIYTFTTLDTPRTIEIGGVSNSRDIGGKLTDEGKYTKQGMIYRSAHFDSVTSMGRKKALNTYNIKTELDLRYNYPTLNLPQEGNVGNNILGTSNYITIKDENGLLGGARYVGTTNGLGIDGFRGKQMLRQQIAVFGDVNNYPINFHCAIGRDRTGCLSMILNALLGVSEKDIFMDYEMSAFSSSGSGDGSNYRSLVNNNLTPSLEYIKTFEGNSLKEQCANFLLDAKVPQSDIDTIRSVMLGGNK